MPIEPVRGQLLEPDLFSLSGLDILRAFMRKEIVGTPLYHLLGPRVTQVSSGTAVMHLALSPWFSSDDDFIELTPALEYIVDVTALTGAPPGSHVRTVSLSMRNLRPVSLESEVVIGRGRILHAGSSFTTVEVLFEDGLGRAVAQGTGSVVVRPLEPPPPPLTRKLVSIDEPVYATPDPARQRYEPDPDGGGLPPFGRLVGARLVDAGDPVRIELPTSDWFCLRHREVSPGILGMVGNLACERAILNSIEPGERFAVLNVNTAALVPVIPDGRSVTVTASVTHRRKDVIVANAEIRDADGQIVCLVNGPVLVRPRERGRRRVADRELLTVLFTDLVGSTERAAQLGDTAWSRLLDDHDGAVARQIEIHNGRKVKSTGDGVLAVFASPSRAVRCARGIRDALSKLDLESRAGVHIGECEVIAGDVAGLAVHIAARIQAAAAPGEILISSAVRELIAASDLRTVDRGPHHLRGLDSAFVLHAVSDDD